MSLDIEFKIDTDSTPDFEANITHNLTDMAEAVGVYDCLWRPAENGYKVAYQLTYPLVKGLKMLQSDPEKFKQYDSTNGWGIYDDFIPFLKKCLMASLDYPDHEVFSWV